METSQRNTPPERALARTDFRLRNGTVRGAETEFKAHYYTHTPGCRSKPNPDLSPEKQVLQLVAADVSGAIVGRKTLAE
jgi:hypothetical protein